MSRWQGENYMAFDRQIHQLRRGTERCPQPSLCRPRQEHQPGQRPGVRHNLDGEQTAVEMAVSSLIVRWLVARSVLGITVILSACADGARPTPEPAAGAAATPSPEPTATATPDPAPP